jgi:glucosyl-dolichyl phosphate glucuronosyltransferase
MKISTILCTYNRSGSLSKALQSIAASVLPETTEWEVLVVDNNSSDPTKTVVQAFCEQYPGHFHYVFEPKQGKSYALNTGIRKASGDVLAFVDDDVIVEPNWLQNLTSPLQDGRTTGTGGRILPAQGFVPPDWLALEGPCNLVGALCAYFNPGDAPGELKEPPFGANMAFRKEMFDKYGDFRTDLGPFPNNKIGFEDTEFGRRLMNGGEHLQYVPSAVVYHEVPEYRVCKGFLLDWWFTFGRGSIRETGKKPSPWELLKVAGRAIATAGEWAFTLDSQRRFYRKCRIWYAAGKIVEACRWEKAANTSAHKLERQAS